MAIDSITGSNTAAQSQATQANAALLSSYDSFLKLFLTQLQHQDPTQPEDASKMAAQLAQFSGVEQQVATNSNLEKLINIINASNTNNIVSYIGKRIEAPGDATALVKGKAEYAYYLQYDADKVNIRVKDGSGNVIYQGTGSTTHGYNLFSWNGKDNNGQTMPDGIYNVEVEALDDSKNEISVQGFMTFVVSAVDSVAGDIFFSKGDLAIPIANVTSIKQPDVAI